MNEDLAARYLAGEPLDDAESALLLDDRAELDALTALLGDAELWAEDPPAGLEDLVVDLVAAEASAVRATDPRRAVAPPVTTGGAAAADVIPLQRARRRTLVASLVSAAAAALVAVIVTVSLGRDRGEPPVRIEVALPDARPGGVSVADTASGLRINLDAPDLERLPDGQFYQAWLRSLDGERLVAVGTFHSGDDVILWAGVKVEDFPTLTVTIEPDDGDAASSGNRVLVVPLLPPAS
ncbi:MAG: anti-sigma factor [Acidimicrobiales bacterium]|nr:anti-sigma factor [Acidimicrobiales bacterium]